MLNVLRCRLTYQGQADTNAEAWFNIALRPRKPEGSLGRTAQDGHLDCHTAPELYPICIQPDVIHISPSFSNSVGIPTVFLLKCSVSLVAFLT